MSWEYIKAIKDCTKSLIVLFDKHLQVTFMQTKLRENSKKIPKTIKYHTKGLIVSFNNNLKVI